MKSWKRIEPTIVSKVGYRTLVSKTFKMPNGSVRHFETFDAEASQAVAILALTEDCKVLICRQYRPGPAIVMDEIPGGRVDEGETPEIAAHRELLEETGYEAGELTHMGVMRYSAYDNMVRHCFLATNCKLSARSAQQDDEEFIELRLITIDELIANARAATMTDPGAILLAYDTLKQLQKEKTK